MLREASDPCEIVTVGRLTIPDCAPIRTNIAILDQRTRCCVAELLNVRTDNA